jgi:hypothetical protein
VGPTRTLPPDHQAPPRTPSQRVNDPLELDQPPSALLALRAPSERTCDHAVALDGIGDQLDVAMDPLEPLGRRTPQPLEASREAVER